MDRDGNGWARCERGHRHWGRHGAAGLLLHAVDDDGVVRLLMQHRAAWSHHGDTWGLPGGARDSHEDSVAAALREAVEETGLPPGSIRTRSVFVDDHGGWSYTTVRADLPRPVATLTNDESHALAWVPVQEVADLPLHPGFAATWPVVRVRPTVMLIDAANVIGARPDGWWRDRPGAAGRLLDGLAALRAATVVGPDGDPRVIAAVAAVLEGAAVAAEDPGWVRVHRAGRGTSGDDLLVDIAAELLAAGDQVVAVSADRGLRARWESLTGAGVGEAARGRAGVGGRAGGGAGSGSGVDADVGVRPDGRAGSGSGVDTGVGGWAGEGARPGAASCSAAGAGPRSAAGGASGGVGGGGLRAVGPRWLLDLLAGTTASVP